jgi:hypothetical protein
VYGYTFTIPSLPRPVYGVLKDLTKEYGVSYWEAIVTGILVFASLTPDERREWLDKTRAQY